MQLLPLFFSFSFSSLFLDGEIEVLWCDRWIVVVSICDQYPLTHDKSYVTHVQLIWTIMRESMICHVLWKKNNSRSKRPYAVTDTWGLRYRLLYHTNAGSLTCANVTIFTGMFMFFGMSKLVLACRDSYFLNKYSKTVSDEKELCRTLSAYFANIVFAITSLCKYTFQLV